jgi:peroxiredoxin
VPLLHPGDRFPTLHITQPGGHTLTVPEELTGSFAAVLFYRGSWCRYCHSQLRAFERARDRLGEVNCKIVALSTDDEKTTAALIEDLGLTFPVGHSADAQSIADSTGAFTSADHAHFQSTGFVLDPSGNVIVSVYSSGAIGRLAPDDVAGLVRHLSTVASGIDSNDS